MSIAVIAGLGNPGPEYAGMRHNIGFAVVDALATCFQASWRYESRFSGKVAKVLVEGKTVFLLKPETYMNESGHCISAFCRFHKLAADQVIVIYDDITLNPSRSKISIHGSSGGHNGIESIFEQFGRGFIRYRIGIGSKSNPAMLLKDYVLTKFSFYERKLLECRMPEFLDDLKLIIDKGVIHAMNKINQKTNKRHEPDTNETEV